MWRLFILLLLLMLKTNDGRRILKYRRSNERQLTNPSEPFDSFRFEELVRAKMLEDIIKLRNATDTVPEVSEPVETLEYDIPKSPFYVTVDPITGKQIMQLGNLSVLPAPTQPPITTYGGLPDVQVVNSNLAPIKTSGPPQMSFSGDGAPNLQNLKITIKLPTHPVVDKLNEYLEAKEHQTEPPKIIKTKIKRVKPVRFLPSDEDLLELPTVKFGDGFSKSPRVEYYVYPTPRPKRSRTKIKFDQYQSESKHIKNDYKIIPDHLEQKSRSEKPTNKNMVFLKRITDPEYINYLRNKQEQRFQQELMDKYKILSVPRDSIDYQKYKVIEDSFPRSSYKQMGSLIPYRPSNYDKRRPLQNKHKPHFKQTMNHTTQPTVMETTTLNTPATDSSNQESMTVMSTSTEASSQGEIPQNEENGKKNYVTNNPVEVKESQSAQSVIMPLVRKRKPPTFDTTNQSNLTISKPKLADNILKDLQNAVTIEKAKVHVIDDPDDAPAVIKKTYTSTTAKPVASPATSKSMIPSPEIVTDSAVSFDDWKPIFYNRTEYVREFYYPASNGNKNNQSNNREHGGNIMQINGKNKGNQQPSNRNTENIDANTGYVYEKGDKKFEEGNKFAYEQHKTGGVTKRHHQEPNFDENTEDHYKNVYNQENPRQVDRTLSAHDHHEPQRASRSNFEDYYGHQIHEPVISSSGTGGAPVSKNNQYNFVEDDPIRCI